MESPTTERRLAAILSADAVGYSGLMARDEESTVRTLTACRAELARQVAAHRGRVVDAPGDNLLAEFRSALDAVSAAVSIQEGLAVLNEALTPDRRMAFRIGVHLGDVLVEGERIYGDGVNIAARLESLAEAGGICVSAPVRDQIRNKLELAAEDLGEKPLKNIPDPVRVYRLRIESAARPRSAPPDRPSIVVLPFANMSGDPDQEYFSDGLSEEITTGLSKIAGLFVIARTSAFVYKAKGISLKAIGEELGVRTVLQGSVRKSGDRLRITAQLIQAATGEHIWGERYDRTLADIFDVQDEVTEQIISALRVHLAEGEQVVREHPPTDNLEAYDLYLRAFSSVHRVSSESNQQARQMINRALELDPAFAPAWALYGLTHLLEWTETGNRNEENLREAYRLTTKAIELDDTLSVPHAFLAMILGFMRRPGEALAEARRAVALGPSEANALRMLGNTLAFSGRIDEAVRALKDAIRLDPHEPLGHFFLGQAIYLGGRPEEAIGWLERASRALPGFSAPMIFLAAARIETDRDADAKALLPEILRVRPDLTIENLTSFLPYDSATLDRLSEALRKAGFP